MNLLIGFVILACLLCSEIRAAEAVGDCWTQTLMVALIAMTVPGLALFQTLMISRKLRDADMPDNQSTAIVSRISVCHSAVWLTASLAIIWAARWQDVVRGEWKLDRWPLVDEVMILAPVVFSLVASWAIFFDVQQSIDGATGRRWTIENIRNRIGYVSIRFRIYFLMILIPIFIAVLSKDLTPWLEQLSPSQSIATFGLTVLLIMAGFPFLLLLIWSNRKVDDPLRTELIETCKQHQLFVHDIRIWNTGNRIVNALVAGLIPRFRIILLSDSLVQYFPRNELLAVVRHEAGHLRLWHLPIRIGFIILPLIALATDERNPLGVLNRFENGMIEMGLPVGSGIGIVIAVYVGYLLISMSWLSHRMEYEADIYACQANPDDPAGTSTDRLLTMDMSDALLRLAAVTPSQFERRSILHPSIRQRIQLLREIQDSPEKARRFRKAFARRRRIVLAALGLVCLFPLVI